MAPASKKKKDSGNSASSTSSQKQTVADDEQAEVPSPRRPASAAEPTVSSTVGLSDLKTTVRNLKRTLATATGDIHQLKKDLQKQVRDSRTEMDSLASRLDKVENKGTMTFFLFCIVSCHHVCSYIALFFNICVLLQRRMRGQQRTASFFAFFSASASSFAFS